MHPNRATFDPNIRGITYDSDNNRIVIVGTARHSTATGAFSVFARFLDTSLSNVKIQCGDPTQWFL